MYLINTTTFKIESFNDPRECKYAILSHTWATGEVTFNDIADLDRARVMPGFTKIEWTCRLALDLGLQHAWVDTCCIDKSSSAELTEAINSMFRWYKGATICFVYLADLPAFEDYEQGMEDNFFKCRWFTRGWTLQELIASSYINFYDCNWTWKGTKRSLQPQLCDITAINIEVLEDCDNLPFVAVGRRMSWASMRQTTREEDLAYCLFGIFDVNLPLLYGEGPKAFIRLQEAIIHESDDLSLFAWTPEDDQPFVGILARKPSEFRACGVLEKVSDIDPYHFRTPFTLTNAGLRIEKDILVGRNEYLLELDCMHGGYRYQDEKRNYVLAISLAKNTTEYVRLGSIAPGTLTNDRYPSAKGGVVAYIPKTITAVQSRSIESRLAHGFAVSISATSGFSFESDYQLKPNWDEANYCFITNGHRNFWEKFTIQLNRPTDSFGEVTPPRWTFPPCEVFFGLEALQNTSETDIVDMTRPLKPWATLHLRSKSAPIPNSFTATHQLPYDPLQHLRPSIRRNGPTVLMIDPIYPDFHDHPPVSEHENCVRLCVSAERDQGGLHQRGPSIMYKLKLEIQKASQFDHFEIYPGLT